MPIDSLRWGAEQSGPSEERGHGNLELREFDRSHSRSGDQHDIATSPKAGQPLTTDGTQAPLGLVAVVCFADALADDHAEANVTLVWRHLKEHQGMCPGSPGLANPEIVGAPREAVRAFHVTRQSACAVPCCVAPPARAVRRALPCAS